MASRASIDQFAHIYAERLGIKEDVLRKTLWGDWYLDAKNKVGATGQPRPVAPLVLTPRHVGARACSCLCAPWGGHQRVVGREQGKGRFKPLFVQFVLENLWAVYDAAMLQP